MAKIKNLQPLLEMDKSATYLVLISPDKIPHLAIVHKENYFSLTYKKATISEPFAPYLHFLKRSNRKMIFIELKEHFSDPIDFFKPYKKVNTQETTCLLPIRDFLLPKSTAGFVYELIPELYTANLIKNAFHINLKNDLDNLGDFNLSIYPKEAIFSYIESLNQKYAKRD